MKTLSIALAATAIAATSTSFIATSAEAGRRGGHHRLHFHLHQLQMHQQRQAYRDDDEGYSYRRKKAAAAKQHVAKQQASKPVEKPVVVLKYADGQGRQFDLTSKVWFDGKGQCFQGSQPFTFKSGGWSYGDARWIESSAGWGVTSGAAPEAVSCDGIKAFEAKLKPTDIKPVAARKVEEPKVQTVQKAELQNNSSTESVAKVVKSTSETTAKAECKKYFPSVGELVTVPCGE